MRNQPKSVCIICGQEKPGIEVKEDNVIRAIRWFKRNVTKNEQGNKLVVCKDCYVKYSALRSKYESRQKLYIALGILFVIFSTIVSTNKLVGLGIGIFIFLLLYLISFLSYIPALNLPKTSEANLKKEK
ncbi:MAG: hypothetical protein ACP5IK_00840 [Candidatus Micrarchaeia archaeon]